MAGQLMVIFSMGGLAMQRHLRSGSVRCSTALVSLGDDQGIVLESFPAKGSRAVVGRDGQARLWRGKVEVPEPVRGRSGLRWTDHQLAGFAAQNLRSWLILPQQAAALGPGQHEMDGHVVWVTGDGHVTRHEERDTGLVHHLRDHCEFGDVTVATRRRTADRHGIPVLWADVVAGHVIPEKSLN